MNKNKGIAPVVLVIMLALLFSGGYIAYRSYWQPTSDHPQQKSQVNAVKKELSWNANEILLNGKKILSIDDFPDDIEVAPGIRFGSSDRIRDVKMSPDGQWFAIAVSGAAHDFGWLYNLANSKLTYSQFSYGGGVQVQGWESSEEVVFKITTPKPSTLIKRVQISSPDVSDWKTYRNEEYGFEFKSPARKILLFPASSADYLSDTREFYGIYGVSNQDYAARVDSYSGTSLASVLTGNRFISTVKITGETTMNGITWTRVGDTDYLVERNNTVYHISGYSDLTAPILSTFRFTK